MVNNHGYIIHKLRHKKGRRHDYDIYTKDHAVTLKEVVNIFDLGYLGIESDFPDPLSSHYHRKGKETNTSCPKKKKSTTKVLQQKENGDREHNIICRLKKYRIMRDIFRNKLRKYNRISGIVSTLINYRIIN